MRARGDDLDEGSEDGARRHAAARGRLRSGQPKPRRPGQSVLWRCQEFRARQGSLARSHARAFHPQEDDHHEHGLGAGRTMRWLRRIVLVVILVPLVLAGGAYLWLRNSLPQTSGTIALVGPTAEIRITRDDSGVPHIAAANDRDASFALGFVHAQDRLFQMDMMQRV